jgi:hypothetical protein
MQVWTVREGAGPQNLTPASDAPSTVAGPASILKPSGRSWIAWLAGGWPDFQALQRSKADWKDFAHTHGCVEVHVLEDRDSSHPDLSLLNFASR